MTEKEFRKLSRQDLLQLLLTQGKEAVQLGGQLAEKEEVLTQSQASNDRLKAKLDEKDAQINKLKERLDEKDAQINKLKERLDEKDAQINKLKGRLDEKDVKIHNLKANIQEFREKRQLEVEEIVAALKLDDLFERIQQASKRRL
ncbi:hypothetical protein [Hominifimenecus sp. rT4P-3]|uniref:hypothetical protein n=1 Tax=Hominifimenecus sp. rT4P-3 TaxID=3242979 RepID=UPI003DA35370